MTKMKASVPGGGKFDFVDILSDAMKAVRIMIDQQDEKKLSDRDLIKDYQPIIAALIQARIYKLEESIDNLYDAVKELETFVAETMAGER